MKEYLTDRRTEGKEMDGRGRCGREWECILRRGSLVTEIDVDKRSKIHDVLLKQMISVSVNRGE